MLCPGRFQKLALDSHMRNRVLMCVLVSLAGCASVGATSGSRGVRFDMSPQEVLARIKPTDIIIEVSDAEIISQGPWDTLPDIRRKTFTFNAGKLQCVRYDYVSGEKTLSNITPIFCK